MDSRNFILPVFCIVLLIGDAHGFVKRDVTKAPNSNTIEPVERDLKQFLPCLDQSLAAVAGQVDVKQLQPVFDILGDQLNRFSKVIEILTSPQSTIKTPPSK